VVDEDFVAMCHREHAQLVRAVTLWCGDRAVAEEVVQEAFARACRDWRRVRRMDRPVAWIWRVAVNLSNSRFRRRQAERRAYGRVAARTVGEHRDPDGADAVAVRRALAGLSPLQRQVVILRFYLDVPVEEIAVVTGRSASAITSVTHRALLRLRADLEVDVTERGEEAHDGA
jgi:RNA polymerase sigma-70 factor (ECF subfamily)